MTDTPSTHAAAERDAATGSGAPRRWRSGTALLMESALVVLSVLLGLALGEWRDHARERALARTALRTFRQEIAGNLAMLETAQPKHAAFAKRLGDAAARPATDDAFTSFVATMPAGGLDTKPLRDVAWETAQTTGALRLLDYETAALLSETYLVQRDALQPTLARLADRMMIPENFTPSQRAAMLRTHQMLLVELSGQEAYLMELYRRVLGKLPER